MIQGGKKFVKPSKTKFKKNRDFENLKINKPKHHDKSTYRLTKEEKDNEIYHRDEN
jgi:hypothetical protein